MTPTFRLNEKTDPATIMFEGYPSITLKRVDRYDNSPRAAPWFFVTVAENPDRVHFHGRLISAGNNHAHYETGLDTASVKAWPRIVPRITLTGDTDPKTVMFADRPDIEITEIRSRPQESVDEPGDVYVETDALCLAVSAHGKIYYPNPRRPKGPIVTRPAVLDPTKPIVATTKDREVFPYKLVGTFMPADGSEAVLHVEPIDRPHAVALEIFASTGKVKAGQMSGSGLQFSNGPLVKTEQLPVYIGGEYYTLDVTKTDGVVTNINWKAN